MLTGAVAEQLRTEHLQGDPLVCLAYALLEGGGSGGGGQRRDSEDGQSPAVAIAPTDDRYRDQCGLVA